MKNRVLTFILFSYFFAHGHEKPQTVTAQFNYQDNNVSNQSVTTEFTYTDNQPFGCNLLCKLSLLQKKFDIKNLRNGLYEEKMLTETKQWILQNREKFLEVTLSGRLLPAFIKYIEIIPDEEVKKNSPEGKFKLDDVNVGISFLFPVPEDVKKLDIKWLLSSESKFDSKKPEGQKEKDFEVSVTENSSEENQLSVNSEKNSFTWFNKHHSPVPERPHREIKTFPKHSQFKLSLTMFGVSLLGVTICWIVVNTPKTRYMSMVYVFILINSISFIEELRGIEEKQVYILPQQDSLEKIMTRLLVDIYRSPSVDKPDWIFEELSKASISNFRDKTFTKIFKGKSENPDTQQIVEELKLESCKITGEKKVECQWVIKAHILHLNHIHSKSLRFKAIFKLKPNIDQWLIEEGKVIPVLIEEQT